MSQPPQRTSPTRSGATGYPTVTSWSPTGQSDVQGSRPDLTIDFSTDMVVSTFSEPSQLDEAVTLTYADTGHTVLLTFVEYVTPSRRVVLRPAEDLIPGATYRVYVANKLPDTFGRKTLYDTVFTFKTSGTSLAPPTLVSPARATVQDLFPALSWTSTTIGATYEVQLDERTDFGSPRYSETTADDHVVPSGSFDPETTYYWRVRATVDGTLGPWSPTWMFYYGRVATSDRTSRQIQEDAEAFRVRRIGWEDGATMLLEHPPITLTLSTTPAPAFAEHVVVWEMDQLPRNDRRETLFERRTPGTWTSVGKRLTFVPTEAIKENTRYELRVSPDLQDVLGRDLEDRERFYWCGAYRPFYCSPRAIRARFRSAEAIPDDLLNFYIFQSSLAAKAKYATYVDGLEEDRRLADTLTEDEVWNGKDLDSHGVALWVQAATVYEILKSILFEELRNVDRTRLMQRFQDTLGVGFMEGIREAFKAAKEEMQDAEGLLVPSGDPISVSRQRYFDPIVWTAEPALGIDLGLRGIDF